MPNHNGLTLIINTQQNPTKFPGMLGGDEKKDQRKNCLKNLNIFQLSTPLINVRDITTETY